MKYHADKVGTQDKNELAPNNALTPNMPYRIISPLDLQFTHVPFLVFHISLAGNCRSKASLVFHIVS
jgi:hypothetical protein